MNKLVFCVAVVAMVVAVMVAAAPNGVGVGRPVQLTVEFVPATDRSPCRPGETYQLNNRTCVTCRCIFNNFARCYPTRLNCVEPTTTTPGSTTPSTTQAPAGAGAQASTEAGMTSETP